MYTDVERDSVVSLYGADLLLLLLFEILSGMRRRGIGKNRNGIREYNFTVLLSYRTLRT